MDCEKKPGAVATVRLRRRRPRPLNMAEVEAVNVLARTLYAGGLIPNGCNRPEGLAVRILAGREAGLSAIQAVSNVMVMNGRATIWGDAALALVRASGELADFAEGVEGEGDDRVGWCRATRVGGETIGHRFSVADARTAKLWGKAGPWTNYPDRMLPMRPRAWVLRDLFPDVLAGLGITEEVQDYTDERPATTVEVVSVTTNPTPDGPAPVGQMVAADHPSALPAPDPATLVDDATLAQLGNARPAFLRGKGIDTNDAVAVKAAWAATLAGYGVSTAKNLSPESAARLLAELRGAGNQQEIREVFATGGGTDSQA